MSIYIEERSTFAPPSTEAKIPRLVSLSSVTVAPRSMYVEPTSIVAGLLPFMVMTGASVSAGSCPVRDSWLSNGVDVEVDELLAEAEELIKKSGGSEETAGFIKKFTKISAKDAREMRKKLSDLGIMKLKEEQTVKITDFLPETGEELNKIFTGNLSEDETSKILDTVKQFI